jgi:hypothetical protein
MSVADARRYRLEGTRDVVVENYTFTVSSHFIEKGAPTAAELMQPAIIERVLHVFDKEKEREQTCSSI